MHTTPYWPAANGEVERQNRSILKALKIGRIKGETLETSLQNYLYMYTVTPHSITGVSPAQLVFGRRFRDKFPHLDEEDIIPEEVKDRDLSAKFKAKLYRDKKVHAKESNIEVGDRVLVKMQLKENKLSPNFHPSPAKVIDRNGSSVTVRTENGAIYRRNSSHLKPLIADEANAGDDFNCYEPENDPLDGLGESTIMGATPSVSSPMNRSERDEAIGRGYSERLHTTADSTERPKRSAKAPSKYKDYLLDFD
ncbi:hypothetical protein RP20_CCG019992 [Aedes albopictus]|nr:hypothetical protein RP20_CCG019992 [Aedes albopictus]